MMCRWTIRGQHRMELPGAKQRVAHFEDRFVFDYSMQNWLSHFIDTWLKTEAPASARKPLWKPAFTA
jgi:GMP synthase (glutamine-hydrolysing)